MLCGNIQCPTRNTIDNTCTHTKYSSFYNVSTCPNYVSSYTPYPIDPDSDSDPANYPAYSSNPANVNGNKYIIDEKNKEIKMLRNTIKLLNKTIDVKNEEILTLKGKIDNSHDRMDV